MSITVTTDVFCDECGAWQHGLCAETSRATQARRIARAVGWRRVKSRDLCPECVKAGS